KVLFQLNGDYAKSNDPATWAPFDYVQTAYLTTQDDPFDGAGFCLLKDIVAFDYDHCVDRATRTITDSRVAGFIQRLDSYSEFSPGDGARVMAFGNLPPEGRREGPFEMYESGRFVTVTGNRIPGTPPTVNHRQEQINEIHTKIFAERFSKREESVRSEKRTQ